MSHLCPMKMDSRIAETLAPVLFVPRSHASLLLYRFSSCFDKQAFEKKENDWKWKILKIKMKIKGLYPELLAPLNGISTSIPGATHPRSELRKLKVYHDAVYAMMNDYIFMALLSRKPGTAKVVIRRHIL